MPALWLCANAQHGHAHMGSAWTLARLLMFVLRLEQLCHVQALEEKNREVAGDEGSDDDFEEGMGDIDVESKPALAID